MTRQVVFGIFGALLLMGVGSLVGMVVAMNIGGNYFTGFELAGRRGYEATAVIGLWGGAAAAPVSPR